MKPLELEVFDRHALILGMTDTGKSHTAMGLTATLLEAGRHTVILDPTGAYFGLQTKRDGSAAFDIPIFGGAHGNIDIQPGAGGKVARIIGERRLSAIIDLSLFDLDEMRLFVSLFIHALRGHRGIIHLIVDEADEFMPEGAMSGDWEWVAKRGRVQGFRLMMITQRPANISKRSSSQASCIIAHRVMSKLDRSAVRAIMDGAGDETQAKAVEKTVGTLARGEAWVWSPNAGVFERRMMPRNATFDSSKTPEPGDEEFHPPALRELDLSAIAVALKGDAKPKLVASETLVDGEWVADERDDRIAELEAMLDTKAAELVGAHHAHAALEGLLAAAHDRIRRVGEIAMEDAAMIVDPAPETIEDIQREIESPATAAMTIAPLDEGPPPLETITKPETGFQFAPRHQNLLDALAWAERFLKKPDVARTVAAFLAKKSPRSSTFERDVGAMRTAGLIVFPSKGQLALTAAGRQRAVVPSGPVNAATLQARIKDALEPRFARELDAVIKCWPSEITREDLAAAIGVSPTSSTFERDLGRLRTLGLLDYPQTGCVRAADFLFGR